MGLDTASAATIATVALGLLSFFLHGRYQKAKRLLEDGARLITHLSTALQDDKVSDDEVKQLVADAQKFIVDLKG